jgi:hypothetical protein
MEGEPGKLTVDEFLRLTRGVLEIFGETRLSPADQVKLDEIFNALAGNDSRVADALRK